MFGERNKTMDMLIFLIIAFITGSIGASLAGSSRIGCLGSIFVGLIGSWVGKFIATKFNLPEIFALHIRGYAYPIIWSIVGAIICVAVLHLFLFRRVKGPECFFSFFPSFYSWASRSVVPT